MWYKVLVDPSARYDIVRSDHYTQIVQSRKDAHEAVLLWDLVNSSPISDILRPYRKSSGAVSSPLSMTLLFSLATPFYLMQRQGRPPVTVLLWCVRLGNLAVIRCYARGGSRCWSMHAGGEGRTPGGRSESLPQHLEAAQPIIAGKARRMTIHFVSILLISHTLLTIRSEAKSFIMIDLLWPFSLSASP